MEKSIFFAGVFLVATGCISFENPQEPFLHFCNSIELDESGLVLVGEEEYIFFLPEISSLPTLDRQRVSSFYSSMFDCYFGWMKGQNKDYLYCHGRILLSVASERASKKQLVEIFVETIFKKQSNSFELVERKCRVFFD